MNIENLKATLAAIEANPDHWDQDRWHCGTSHCIAGFAEMLRLGLEPTGECTVDRFLSCALASSLHTREWLGLTVDEWGTLTDNDTTLEMLREWIAAEKIPDVHPCWEDEEDEEDEDWDDE